MRDAVKILVLAGSGEARKLLGLLSEDPSLNVIASLSGATRHPLKLPVETRVGGFGSAEAQREYILAEQFDLVVDATHPFAANISVRTQRICREITVPYLHIRRAGWLADEGDDWTIIDHPEDAVTHINRGSTVFLATGRSTLLRFSNLSEMQITCRQIDPPEAPFPFQNGSYLVGNPPFSIEAEEELFKRLKVDVLVVKNAGGTPSRTKLDAARRLGIKVLMLKRPPLPEGDHVETVEAAIDWINSHQENTV